MDISKVPIHRGPLDDDAFHLQIGELFHSMVI